MAVSLQGARELAGMAIGFIAADATLTSALLDASGMRPEDLRAAAGKPEFDQFLLDFLLQDDQRVLDFSASTGIRPESVLHAREILAHAPVTR